MPDYIKKEELIKEIEKCLKNDVLKELEMTEEDVLPDVLKIFSGANKVVVSDKLCRMFYLIAKRLSSVYMFDYEDKQDMIQTAVTNCIKYFIRFDTNKDVFAYATQICKHSFYQFFNKEGKYKIFISDMLSNASKEFEKKYKNK